MVPPAATQTTHARPPLHFERNEGQTDAAVRFLARGPGYVLFLTPDEAVVALRGSGQGQEAIVRMRLVAALKSPDVVGEEQLAGVSHSFVGNDPSRWRTGVPHYGRVTYREVYRGIDLTYHGTDGRLEYDFVVRPGADPHSIRLRFDGATSLRVADDGDLLLATGVGEIVQEMPRLYQVIGGRRRTVGGRYARVRKNEVGFEVGPYDRSAPLVIDPVLAYSTYLGGAGNELARGVAVDADGNTYITGSTTSSDFPVQGPLHGDRGGRDAFVTKLGPDGSLVFSTYLGGDGDELSHSVAVDASHNVYVSGETPSLNFPTMGPIQAHQAGIDGFLTKLAPSGAALVYSTYLGGDGIDYGAGVALDSAGNAYVVGGTESTDFPTVGPFQGDRPGPDAFVAKVSASGSSLVYSTYLGGSATEDGYAIGVDDSGIVRVTGRTSSSDFPTLNPVVATNESNFNVFVTALSAAGSQLVYSTYLGRGHYDGGTIAVDAAGNAWVAGETRSQNLPLLNPIQASLDGVSDAFVTKLSPAGAVIYSTYLGGSSLDEARGIAVDAAGQAHVTGVTSSVDFPTVDALQADQPGSDAFLAKLSASGAALVYSTYLGGAAFDSGHAIAVDYAGVAHIAGETSSSNFPTVDPVQTDQGGSDVFVARISPESLPRIAVSDVSVTEADSAAVFTVALSEPAADSVTVNWATTAGGAQAGADFVAASGVLTFAPSETMGTVTVSILQDTQDETTERFFVDLTAPDGASIADARGRGTIVDDDPRPTLSIADATVVEGNSGGSSVIFTVTLSGASGRTVSVSFSTGNAGTAAPGGDYIARNGTLKFYAGQTSKTFVVTAIGDTNPELDETFYVNLASPLNAGIADGQAKGTIVNDDPLGGIR